jgi:predicted ArsR family transcriptional regulator
MVYLWLRERDEGATAVEVAEAVGVSKATAISRLNELAEADAVSVGRRHQPRQRGRNPKEWRPRVPCRECSDWFEMERGRNVHAGEAHSISASDLAAMDPDEIGEDPSPPPAGGR